MKKRFLPLLFVAALGMSVTSCTEVLEANVNNTHTFTVDFTKLVEAINNMNNTLDSRIAALNELLNNRLADITLSIDENTGAITAQTTALQGSLDGINGSLNTINGSIGAVNGSIQDVNSSIQGTNDKLDSVRVALFDGFAALKTTMTENGNKLVTAINDKGELIAAKLDKNNQLIETEVVGKLADLNATIADGNAKMDAKMEALNGLISSGLVKLDGTNAELTKIGAGITGLQTSIDGVNTQLQSIDGSLNGISTQIQGTNGQLENLNTSMTSLNKNVKDLSSQLTDDFVALGQVIAKHDTLIVEAINKQGQILELGFNATNENFAKLNEQMQKVNGNITDVNGNIIKTYQELEKMNTNIGNTNDNLATANGKLEAISTKIENLNLSLKDENSGLPALIKAQQNLKTAIDNANQNISDKIDGTNTQIGGTNTKIDALTTQEKENAQKIVDAIEKLLNDEGIYSPTDGSKDKLYMTYSAYAELTAAGTNSDVYKNIMSSIKEYEVKVVAAQKAVNYSANETGYGMPAEGSAFYDTAASYKHYHNHCTFTETSKSDEKLVAGNYGVNANSGTTRKTYQVIHTYGDIKYSATLINTCNYPIYAYGVKDARGIVFTKFNSTAKTQENLTMQAAYNGTIVSEIQLIVYCGNSTQQDFDFDYNATGANW